MIAVRRLQKLKDHPIVGISDMKVDDILIWKFKISFIVSFPEAYPFAPPTITLASKIRHPNIDTDGKVNLIITNADHWKPATRIEEVLKDLVKAMDTPEADLSLEAELKEKFKSELCRNRLKKVKKLNYNFKHTSYFPIIHCSIDHYELLRLKSHPINGITDLKVDEQNITKWNFLVVPTKSPYNKGAFRVDVTFPKEYPFSPPMVTLATKIYHPNIDVNGNVCLLVTNDDWQSETMDQVLKDLVKIINDPEPDHPLRPDLAKEFTSNRNVFNKNAEKYTVTFAEKRQPAASAPASSSPAPSLGTPEKEEDNNSDSNSNSKAPEASVDEDEEANKPKKTKSGI